MFHRDTLRAKVIVLGRDAVGNFVPVAHVVRGRATDNFFHTRGIRVVNVLRRYAAHARARQTVFVIIRERIRTARRQVAVAHVV